MTSFPSGFDSGAIILGNFHSVNIIANATLFGSFIGDIQDLELTLKVDGTGVVFADNIIEASFFNVNTTV